MRLGKSVVFCALIAGLVTLAWGLNYQSFSDNDMWPAADNWFLGWQGDTASGPVRANAAIYIILDAVFYDYVISTEFDFWRGTGYNPQFRGPVPVFNAPAIELPTEATWIREQAALQDLFFAGGDTLAARVRLSDHSLRVWWAEAGMPWDTSSYSDYALPDTATAFFDCPDVYLAGTVNSVLILGTSGRIGLEDNVLYASSNPVNGVAPRFHPEKLAVVAEGEIKVLNTFTNGRENSSGLGWNQTNQALTSIVLCGVYAALGSRFTFAQQNDPDSGYVCTPCGCNGSGGGPDRRGTIQLFGSLYQRHVGYLRRYTRCTFTGYLHGYHYDRDLKFWDIHLFDARENVLDREIVDFGEVAVGQATWDTVTIANDFIPLELDCLVVSPPFVLVPVEPDTLVWHPRLAVGFFPLQPGNYLETATVYLDYYGDSLLFLVTGNAVTLGSEPESNLLPATFDLAAFPNPFNAQTTLSLSVPTTGPVTVEVFDLLGRRVAVLYDGVMAAGEQRVMWDGSRLSSGLYFVRMAQSGKTAFLKLALLK